MIYLPFCFFNLALVRGSFSFLAQFVLISTSLTFCPCTVCRTRFTDFSSLSHSICCDLFLLGLTFVCWILLFLVFFWYFPLFSLWDFLFLDFAFTSELSIPYKHSILTLILQHLYIFCYITSNKNTKFLQSRLNKILNHLILKIIFQQLTLICLWILNAKCSI